MELLLALNHRFIRTPDGAVWTEAGYTYSLWQRYLAVFDRVQIVARVRDATGARSSWRRADGEAVTWACVPYYLGPMEYAWRVQQVRHAVRRALGHTAAVILHGASPIGQQLAAALRPTHRPYGLEVIGDPYESFAPGSNHHPLRPFFRWWLTREQRRLCREAHAVMFVTRAALQRRYPASPPVPVVVCTDAQLPPAAFVAEPRDYATGAGAVTLLTSVSLAQPYKGVDVLIAAVALCVRAGLNLRLVVAGDGAYRRKLEHQATEAGLGERVQFLGQVSFGEPMRALMDHADLFVLASRTEGLPRALLEAMARGLPCIGTSVGGIPELLAEADLVPPDQPAALADRIREAVSSPARLRHMAARNLETARRYDDSVLREQRLDFYRGVAQATERWLEGSGSTRGDLAPEVRHARKMLQ
jgi:glycosyltransferase involved in cell wall biosynthesis